MCSIRMQELCHRRKNCDLSAGKQQENESIYLFHELLYILHYRWRRSPSFLGWMGNDTRPGIQYRALRRVAREEGVDWVDLADRFLVQERRLWASDGLHRSNCTGLPRLLAAVAKVCNRQEK